MATIPLVTQNFKLCANLNFIYQEYPTLIERYERAAQFGFKGVETGNPYVESAEALDAVRRRKGLEQVLINTPMGDASKGEVGFASLPGKEEQFLEGLEKAISYAKTLNCDMIHIMAGLVTDQPIELHHATYKANLEKAAEILNEVNIIGVIEPINHHSVPMYYLSSYDTAMSVVKELESDYIGLQLDLFHLQMIKGNITNSLKTYFPYTKHIQIAQAPRRNEPNSFGELNYEYVFDTVKHLGYNRWIGLEYRPLSSTASGMKWIQQYGLRL